MKIVKQAFEFEWDKGNASKNLKHKVDDKDAEEVFLDENKIIYRDILHSQFEERYIILGKTKQERLLYVAFTYRKKQIRIISARDINKKEVLIYEKSIKNS